MSDNDEWSVEFAAERYCEHVGLATVAEAVDALLKDYNRDLIAFNLLNRRFPNLLDEDKLMMLENRINMLVAWIRANKINSLFD